MTIRVRHVYGISLERLYGLLTSEDFLRSKYEGIGSRKLKFQECGLDEEIFRIRWTREVPSNPPAFARAVLGEWNRLEEIMEWSREPDGTTSADYQGRVTGVPGVLEGRFGLAPGDGGCVEDILMRATIHLPLVGGRIAAFAEDDARRNLEAEYAFTRAYLGEA